MFILTDVEIKLDEEGYVLPASQNDEIYKRYIGWSLVFFCAFTSIHTWLCYVFYRIALCIDGQRRFTSNKRQLLGKEVIKQRHLKLLGYEVVQVGSSTLIPS